MESTILFIVFALVIALGINSLLNNVSKKINRIINFRFYPVFSPHLIEFCEEEINTCNKEYDNFQKQVATYAKNHEKIKHIDWPDDMKNILKQSWSSYYEAVAWQEYLDAIIESNIAVLNSKKTIKEARLKIKNKFGILSLKSPPQEKIEKELKAWEQQI